MVVTRGGFSQIVGNGLAGFGFAPEGPSVYEFPVEMFLPGSDLTPIRENIDKIVYGLTKWQPKITKKGVYYPAENIKAQGKDYREAEDNMNFVFLKSMWGDGLPIIPPTPERVAWMLTGTELPVDKPIGTGKVLPRGGIFTPKEAAICLVMAGGRPEYLPVVLAAMDAILDTAAQHQSWQATTQNPFPAVIVNGPLGKQIRLHSGYGVMGPDPVRSAGGPIGRALRLILMDLGGAVPGIGTMAIYGPMRFTNAILAEDEDGTPWETLSVERGFPKGSNVVTMTSVASSVNVNLTSTDSRDAAGAQKEFLMRMVQMMLARQTPQRECPGLILLPREHARALANLGYTKLKVKEFLWEQSKLPWEMAVATGRAGNVTGQGYEGKATPVTKSPNDLLIAIAGGAQSGHSWWMQAGMMSQAAISREIKLPAKWNDLIKQAEKDLGPIPAG